MLVDGLHFAFKEAVAVFVVAYLFQFCGQGLAFAYPAVEVLQGGSGFAAGAVELCQFGFGVGADDEFGLRLMGGFGGVHDFDYLVINR